MAKRLICCLFFFLIPVISCNKKSEQAHEISAIQELIQSYNAAFDQKDFNRFSSFCTDDMNFFTLDGQIFDSSTLVPFLNRILKNWQNLKTTTGEVKIEVDSQIAWAKYKSQLVYTSGEKQGVMNNLITVTFRKTETGWKIAHYHMSTGY